jgi:hypothetical protein
VKSPLARLRPRRPLYCSFCRRDEHAVDKLVGGPGVHICDACVGLCVRILAGRPTPPFPGWSSLGDEQLLATLVPASATLDAAAEILHQHVAELRRRGVSWARIGAALGVSRQAAWERFA